MLKIKGNFYILSAAVEMFNTSFLVKNNDGKFEEVPRKITRDEFLKGLENGDKQMIAFAEAQIDKGSPFFISPTETDLENIKILEDAAAEVERLKVELVKAQTDCNGFEAQLTKATEANKALEAEIKALKKAGTAKATDDKQGGV